MDLALGRGISGFARKLSGQSHQRRSFRPETLLADVEGHKGIAVGRDDIGAGLDELAMYLAHDLRAFRQRKGRPFWLLEPGAEPAQLTAHAAIKDSDRARHVSPSLELAFCCPSRHQQQASCR